MTAEQAVEYIKAALLRARGFKAVHNGSPTVVAFMVDEALDQLNQLREFRGDIQRACNDMDEAVAEANGDPVSVVAKKRRGGR